MNRRTFLRSAAAAGVLATGGTLATPAISQRGGARALRLVPHADLANFDPIWTTAYMARNAGLLVWDMLYGVDNKLHPQRQMIESETVSPDGLTWTFRLRPGLKFHDGEPVLAKDAVASINRWAARDAMGQMIKAIEKELVAVDDRTFRWELGKPYPKMLLALGKISTPCCFIMPARIAATDPFKQINEHVGSHIGVREIRGLCPAIGTRIVARGRQAHSGGPYRVGRDRRPGHGRRRVAERRGRLAGIAAARYRPRLAQEPQRIRGCLRSHGLHRHLVLQSPLSAV
jgi:ABC-type transport system substrate-binding protein